MSSGPFDPVIIPAPVWERPEVRALLRDRDMGALFRFAQQYGGASQTRLAVATGIAQGRISEIIAGRKRVTQLDVFERIADGLNMPDTARMVLGLAPRTLPPSPTAPAPVASGRLVIHSRDNPVDLDLPSIVGSLEGHPDEGEGDDPVRRRTFTRLTGASLFGAILGDQPGDGTSLGANEAFVAALAGRPDGEGAASVPPNIDLLRVAVATAKRNYQDCRYSTVVKTLPSLLADLQKANGLAQGDSRHEIEALSAEAHHVAASILLKQDDNGLAWVAAERSMQAARNSQDPTIIGSSARIITHALMDDGHLGAATRTASDFAQRLDRDIGEQTQDSLSVYGSLLLRGAVAAGQRNDRHTAATLLDEAQDAGERLGGDYNFRWTAFGPTNVQLHRVNIALLLGDAGAAIQEARAIDFDRIELTERKAALLTDISRALTQWGKHKKAYETLRLAHELAPEEISTRPAVHRLFRDLSVSAPPSVGRQVREFSSRIGVRL